MKSKPLPGLLITTILAIPPQVGFAQTNIDERALKLVSQFSADVCGPYETTSTATRIEINGGLNAKILGLLKGFASGGFGTAAKYSKEDSSGVLQRDLAALNITRVTCREKVAALTLERLRPQSTTNTLNLQTKPELKQVGVQVRYPREKESSQGQEIVANRNHNRTDGAYSPIIVGDHNQIAFNTTPSARYLTSEQETLFKNVIKELPEEIKVNVRTVMSLEAQNYASQLHKIVRESGRSELVNVPINTYSAPIPKGIFAVTLKDDDQTARYRNLLVQRLRAAQIPLTPANNGQIPERVIDIIVSENSGLER